MGLFALITVPGASDMIASSTVYSSAMFLELIPYALAVAGLVLAASFVKYIVFGGFKGAVQKLIGGGRRRRRGRRR